MAIRWRAPFFTFMFYDEIFALMTFLIFLILHSEIPILTTFLTTRLTKGYGPRIHLQLTMRTICSAHHTTVQVQLVYSTPSASLGCGNTLEDYFSREGEGSLHRIGIGKERSEIKLGEAFTG